MSIDAPPPAGGPQPLPDPPRPPPAGRAGGGTGPPAPPFDPRDLEPAVATLLEAVPEFGRTYLLLVEEFDDDPGSAVTFTELAGFVTERLDALEGERTGLLRALAVVEAMAGGDGPGSELVAYAFLDSLSPDECRRLGPWLGDATRALLDGLEVPG